ncbi:MAG: TIR domain-containing protein [Gammaproteobacteria bacterium]|nr:TIR domain-containing protein [Gammaproteobacteria bacterium]
MSKFDVFLSYNRDDKDAVNILHDRLRQQGINPFLDNWNLIPGDPRQEGLEQALASSVTVAVFVGPSGIQQWNNAQMRVAIENAVRTRDEYRVIPVLLPEASEDSMDGFLGLRVWVDFRPGLDDTEAIERLVAGIKGEVIVGGAYTLPDEPTPYRGLLRFEEEQSRFFFGREQDCRELVEKLNHNNFVAIVGASGSGKSSLVRAGLIPVLKKGGLPDSRHWRYLICTPGRQPVGNLAIELTKLAKPPYRPKLLEELPDFLATSTDRLHKAALSLLGQNDRSLLLVVDQFEELFTMCPPKEIGEDTCRNQAEHFVATLADAAQHSDGRIRVVIVLRGDFMDRCLSIATLRDLLQNRQLLLGPLSKASLREAIARPAKEVGAYFEKELVSTILRDVSTQPGALPLLQHVLYELWRAREGPWLTYQAYRTSGGVSGALQRRAQATYNALTPKQQEIARNIFLRLTTLGEGVSDTRRQVDRSELSLTGVAPNQVETVLQILSGPNARLVVVDKQSKVEVTHEALIQQWDTLQSWLEADRQALRLHRHLTQTAQEWARLEHESGELYRGGRLAQAEEWAQSHGNALNDLEQEFLETSIAERERVAQEREAQHQRELETAQKLAKEAEARRQAEAERAQEAEARADEQQSAASSLRRLATWLAVAGGTAILLAILAGWFGVLSSRNADRAIASESTVQAMLDEALTSRSVNLAALANSNLNKDPELSILLAIEAITPTYTTMAEDALRRALHASRAGLTLTDHKAPLNSVAYSPNEVHLASADNDGVVKIWVALSGQVVQSWSAHAAPIRSINFNQDGTLLATAGDDQTAIVWDSTSGQSLLRLSGHTGPINSVAFSPDGKQLATASSDMTARLWDLTAGPDQAPLVLGDHSDEVNDLAFSPDGTRVATVSSDKQVRVWNITTGELLLTLSGHERKINGVAFSPCLNAETPENECQLYLATGSQDKAIKIWDVNSGGQLLSTWFDPSTVYSMIFSPDGKYLATASADRTAKVWDLTSGEALLTLAGHSEPVYDVAFSLADDGLHLATASTDKTIKIWNLGNDKETLSGHAAWANRVVFSPDGNSLVSTSVDGTARVWDVVSRQSIKILDSHQDKVPVPVAAFNPAGTRLATTSFDGTIKIWDTTSWAEVHTIDVGARVGDVAYSHDGTRLAATSFDSKVRVWNSNSWETITTLDPEGEVFSVVFSPDGKLIVTGGHDQATVWMTESGEFVRTLPVKTGNIFQMAFNPNIETQLVTSSGAGRTTAKVWDITTGNLLYTLDKGHTAQVNSLAFNPQGNQLATASSDKTVMLWNAGAGSEQTPLALPEHAHQVGGVTFSPDGKYLAAAIGDGTVRLHYLDIDDLLAEARLRLSRGWRTEECFIYLHPEQCPSAP